MELFGIGWMEMIVIGLVALIVVGPQRLPQAARAIGRLVGLATRQWQLLQQQLREPVEGEVAEIRRGFHEVAREVTDIAPLDEATGETTATRDSR